MVQCRVVQCGAMRCRVHCTVGGVCAGWAVVGRAVGPTPPDSAHHRICYSDPEDLLFHGFLDLFASGFVGVIGPVKNP